MPEPTAKKRPAPRRKIAARKKKTTAKPKTGAERDAAVRAASERPARASMPSAFNQPLTPSPELARVIGKRPKTRVEVVKKLWMYIKRHKLQNKTDKRMIDTDAKLRAIYGERAQVSLFELSGALMRHLHAEP